MRDVKDQGVALLAVIGLGLLMMLVIATGLTTAVAGLGQSSSDQRSSSALDAAYAGVQDYLARINLDSNYVRYGNRSAAFSNTSTVTLPSAANAAFGVSPSGSWATVPGSDGNASFRYEVDNSAYVTNGVVRVRSTGRSGQLTRSVVASFRMRGFVDYTYFTDYEIQDPQITGADVAACTLHAWENRPSGCGTIQFGTRDALDGRVHSNDTMVICGATFTGSVTTANPNSPLYSTSGCTSTSASVPITRAAQLPMPSTNTAMLTDARCLYTGPTQITYNDDGTMTVVSPWTNFTNVSGSTGSNPPACGTLAALRSTAGATVPQLSGDMLYVQTVPLLATDPNYWAASATPTGLVCIGSNGLASGTGTGIGWSLTTGSTTIRYPRLTEYPASNWRNSSNAALWSTTTPAYGCRNGDLYVKGTVSVPTTAGSDNYVYVIDDVTYGDRTQDVFGLVGQNAVLVYNPMTIAGIPLVTDQDREIDAAILSVAHTFQVQNYNFGAARGALTVFGSIAQKFRGPVATLSGTTIATGYSKAYSYDPLLSTVSPPKYLSPSAVSFLLQRYAGVPRAFTASGATP